MEQSRGNQIECGLRENAKLSHDEYSQIIQMLLKGIYVSDCISVGKLV